MGPSNRPKFPDPRRPESQKEGENKDKGAEFVEMKMVDPVRPWEANPWKIKMAVAKEMLPDTFKSAAALKDDFAQLKNEAKR